MRLAFAEALHKEMAGNPKIWLLTGDVGFGVLDKIRDDYPDRFLNCGVAEQNMVGMACGMAQGGLIPFVYSITPFLIYRGFEFIRNDVDYDKANVKLIGTGRSEDYGALGFSHICNDDHEIIGLFPNIIGLWPTTKEEIPSMVDLLVKDNQPYYLNLTR